ncbi:MAG: VTT domain-containing protein [Rhodospirillales bacterium]|nr:VTT domain-containing protein [Rhodospirillales bacterium]
MSQAALARKVLIKGGILILTLVLAGYALKSLGLGTDLSEHWVDSAVKGQGLKGEMVYLLAGLILVGAGFPRQAVCFMGGYAFGFLEGMGWAMLASMLGCFGCFYYTRYLGRSLVQRLFGGRLKKIDAFLAGNPFSMALLIRLLPLGSNLLTNVAAGVSSIKPLPFFGGTALGYIPQTLVFVLLGSGIQVDSGLRTGLSLALFVVSAAMGVYLYRHFRKGRHLGSEDDAELEGEN